MRSCELLTPATLAELAEALAVRGARLIAGGTDLMIALHEGRERPACLIDLSGVACLREIHARGEVLEVGACAVFHEIEKHPLLLERVPALCQAAAGVGSPQIRNRGTIGGNLANASPAGDLLPVLLALQACAVVMNHAGACRKLSAGALVAGVNQNSLAPDEVILRFVLPLPPAGSKNAFAKLGARQRVSIAKINLALAITLQDGVITHATAALGAVGRQAFCSARAAEVLQGRAMTSAPPPELIEILASEIEESIPDRPSLPYKRAAVAGLAEDLWARLSSPV